MLSPRNANRVGRSYAVTSVTVVNRYPSNRLPVVEQGAHARRPLGQLSLAECIGLSDRHRLGIAHVIEDRLWHRAGDVERDRASPTPNQHPMS